MSPSLGGKADRLSDSKADLEEPLVRPEDGSHVRESILSRSSHVEEVPPGLITLERQNSALFSRGAHWLQTTSALLALQLGWGLWLFPADFARLGWYTSAGCVIILAALTTYSGFLFSRLYKSSPGAVLFGDIGFRASGSVGRNMVYVIIYTLDATRCIILHLAASQSLRHIFPESSRPAVWECGAVVLVAASVLVQIRSLAELSWVFTAGTGSQLVAIGIVLFELIIAPNPDAKHSTQAVTWETIVPASVAVMNVIFAFGGQFAFIEIMSSMQKPAEFPRSVTVCTILMAGLYSLVGIVGYWSRGDAIEGIIIFSLGDSPRVRFAAALILVQATSQYLVNLNVWTHNLLTLLVRNTSESEAESIKCSSDHCPRRWLYASVFVVVYSYLISTTVPYFSTLVGLVTSSTYLVCAYVLPAWFTLRLLGTSLSVPERVLLWALIPLSFAFSGVGLFGSIADLVANVEGGEAGWKFSRT